MCEKSYKFKIVKTVFQISNCDESDLYCIYITSKNLRF